MSLSRKLRQTRITTLMGIAALCVGTGALAGCGGGSSTSQTSTQRAPPTAAGNADVGTAKVQTQAQRAYVNPTTTTSASHAPTRRSHAPATSGGSATTGGGAHPSSTDGKPQSAPAKPDKVTPTQAVKVQKARPTPGASKDDQNTRIAATNPCTLVSASEAQSITGGSVGAIEAPQGPTCIYKVAGAKTSITMAVESISLAQVTHQIAKPAGRVQVGTHPAYCVKLGTQMLFVPLSGSRLLNVTAPCSVAQRFAALALNRLSA